MPHDKIKSAVRARMARTGEPYAAARRAVLRERQGAGEQPAPDQPGQHEPRRFLISYRQAGLDRPTAWFDTLLGSGPGRSGVLVTPGQLRIRMGDFRLAVPRASVRSAARSQASLHGTTGVHIGHGRLLVNGGPDGLVELTLDPPTYTGRGLSTLFTRARVDTLVLSLEDPTASSKRSEHPGPGTPGDVRRVAPGVRENQDPGHGYGERARSGRPKTSCVFSRGRVKMSHARGPEPGDTRAGA